MVRTSDPLDGRACLLPLSEEGRTYLAESHERRAGILREILSDWTESEAEAASSSVQHLTAALRSAASGAAGHVVLGAPGSSRTTAHPTGNDGRHLDPSSEIRKEAF